MTTATSPRTMPEGRPVHDRGPTTDAYLFGPVVVKIRQREGVWKLTPHGQALGEGMARARPSLVGKSVIEIGAGTGVHAIAALKLGAGCIDVTEIDPAALRQVLSETEADCFMIFTRECVHPRGTVHARMFALGMGVVEDPATGSASGALGAYLVKHKLVEARPTARILVEQGYDPEVVRKVSNLLDVAEYKRRQAPPGVKITRKAFGRDRRYPITNAFRRIGIDQA